MAIDLTGKAVTTLKLPTTSYTGIPIETVYAQEGDINSRVFRIRIYDDRGTIDLTPYNKVILSATSENGGVYASQGEIIDGYGVCGISSEMMAAEGRLSCNFLFTGKDGEDNDIILTSRGFYLIISKTHGGNGDIDENVPHNLFIELIEKMTKFSPPFEIKYDYNNERFLWDFSQGSNVVIEIHGNEPNTNLVIENVAPGDFGFLKVKGGTITFPANSTIGVDLGYLTANTEEYYRFSFFYDGEVFEWSGSVKKEVNYPTL